MRSLHNCPVRATCAGAGHASQDGGGSYLREHSREGQNMNITRRHRAVAGTLALGGFGLWRSWEDGAESAVGAGVTHVGPGSVKGVHGHEGHPINDGSGDSLKGRA